MKTDVWIEVCGDVWIEVGDEDRIEFWIGFVVEYMDVRASHLPIPKIYVEILVFTWVVIPIIKPQWIQISSIVLIFF